MARIPKRLYGPAALTNAAATVYTVPTATKTVVRHIHVQNPSGAAMAFTLSIGADAAATRLFDGVLIPAVSAIDLWGYYVMEATQIIQALAGTTTVLVLTINGDEIVLG